MATWISARMGQFTYFDRCLGNPDWTGRRVLDFGGNVGNLLLDPDCRVAPEDYWSIDVSRDAIAEGRRRHPRAHFVFFDRYNYEYNPTGTPGLPIPDPGVRFDFIVGMSVITHNNERDSLEFIDQLMALLTEDGRLALTFIDPGWVPPPDWTYAAERADAAMRDTIAERVRAVKPDFAGTGELPGPEQLAGVSNLRWMLGKRHALNPDVDVERVLAQAPDDLRDWVTLMDGGALLTQDGEAGPPAEKPDDPVDHRLGGYLNLCTAEYMAQLFPSATILPPADDRQHCLVLDARDGTGRT